MDSKMDESERSFTTKLQSLEKSVKRGLATMYDTKWRCCNCEDQNHDRRHCPETGWTLRLFNFKHCSSALLGREQGKYAVERKVSADGVSLPVEYTQI